MSLVVGALLTTIARRILFLPVLRYVDDFFSVARAGTAKFAMNIFARSALQFRLHVGATGVPVVMCWQAC